MENSSCKVFILNRGIVTDTMSNHTPRARMVWSAFHSTKAVVSLGEWGLSNGLQRFWLYHCDHCRALTQVYIFVAVTHLGYECFCLPISCHCSNARFDFCWQYSSQDRPTKILNTLPWLLSCTDTLVCWNSPWWRSCEHFMTTNVRHVATLMLESGKQWQPEGIQVIGMSCKPATYNYKGSLWMRLEYVWVEPNRVCPSIHKVRIRHDTMSVVATWTNTSLKKVKCSEM